MQKAAVWKRKGATTSSFSASQTGKDTRKTKAVGEAFNRHGYEVERESERPKHKTGRWKIDLVNFLGSGFVPV